MTAERVFGPPDGARETIKRVQLLSAPTAAGSVYLRTRLQMFSRSNSLEIIWYTISNGHRSSLHFIIIRILLWDVSPHKVPSRRHTFFPSLIITFFGLVKLLRFSTFSFIVYSDFISTSSNRTHPLQWVVIHTTPKVRLG